MDRLKHEIEHGKKISKNAESVWNWDSPAGKVRADRRANYLVEYGGFKKGDKVLEIGCGTGLFTEKIYNLTGADITAIDVSPELLEQARGRGLPVDFLELNAMETPFEEEWFSSVCGSSVLHHLDMQAALKEIYRVLKPGGKIVFAEPNIFNPHIFIERNVPLVKRWLGVSPDETAVNRWKMNKLLKECGFAHETVFPYDFLHPHTPELCIGMVNRLGSIIEKIPGLKEIAGSVIIYAQKPLS